MKRLGSMPRSRWDAVIKIGGSLGRGKELRPLLDRLSRLARSARLLAVPGGGVFADLVRSEWRRCRLTEETAHRMALRAMDQYGLLLASLCPGSIAVSCLTDADRVARAGGMPVLLAGTFVEAERGLEHSFRLTSDSIAAYLADRVGADRLVLLKSTPKAAGRVTDLDVAALAKAGVVDPLFPVMMSGKTEVWIVNGRSRRSVDRLSESLARRV